MAIINKKTGYYGYTLDGTVGGSSDIHGRVNRCIFAIVYPHHVTNVKFTMTEGADDWGAQMGDGNIIPLINPRVLYVNKDSAIIQFDMKEVYAANSPCILVYRSDTSGFTIKDVNTPDPEFQVGHASGNFAFTSEGYGAITDLNGHTNKIIATFAFPTQVTKVKFSITTDSSHWGAYMGDGQIIHLINPEVIQTNSDCAVVVFTLENGKTYPSNSPCLVVYMNQNASITIVPDETVVWVNVQDIIDVPKSVVSGVPYDLSIAGVMPFKATKQAISWSIVSGSAVVDGDMLTATKGGTIKLRGTVFGGLENGQTDFNKDFTITAGQNEIFIDVQPDSHLPLVRGRITEKLAVIASCTSTDLHFKWFKNSSASTSGALAVNGGNEAEYQIPPSLEIGTHYYFCQLSSPGATTLNTIFCTVEVGDQLEGIDISPKINSYRTYDEQQFKAIPLPTTAALPIISWETSNPEIVQVDTTGKALFLNPGTAKIKATADPVVIDAAGNRMQYWSEMQITVAEHVSVTDITGVKTSIVQNTPTSLGGTVIPGNATNQTIIWTLIDPGSTGATIRDGIITAATPGTIYVRATIVKGSTVNTDFERDFYIEITKAFVPVTDITLFGVPENYRVGDPCVLGFTVTPEDADNSNVTVAISNAGTTGAVLTDTSLTVTNKGTVTIIATILNGIANGNNFTKTFQISVNEEFVTVDNIVGIPERWENVESPLKINTGIVSPSNATNNEILYTLKSGSSANAVMDSDYNLTMDYENITWWKKNPNPQDFVNFSDQWLQTITDPIIIEVRVIHGLSDTEDFVQTINIGIDPPPSPDVHIPLENIEAELPSIVRARRPILCNNDNLVKTPWNATNGAVHMNACRLYGHGNAGGFSMPFTPSDESPDYWKEHNNIDITDPDYDWSIDALYLFIFENGNFNIRFTVEKADAAGMQVDFYQPVTVLPAYIPVSNIGNIPIALPKNAKVLLYGECETDYSIGIQNTETYDCDIPSYTDITWSIVDEGTTGASVDKNGFLTFEETGTCKILATVKSGIHEKFDWYDLHHEEKSYTQEFTINIEDEEVPHGNPVVTLKLTDGRDIKIYKESDIINISNDLPADADITVNNITFKKRLVKEIKFWDENAAFEKDDTIPITKIECATSKLELSLQEEKIDGDIVDYTLDDFTPIEDSSILEGIKTGIYSGYTSLPKGDTFIKEDGQIIQFGVVKNKNAEVSLLTGTDYLENVDFNPSLTPKMNKTTQGHLPIMSNTSSTFDDDVILVSKNDTNDDSLDKDVIVLTKHSVLDDVRTGSVFETFNSCGVQLTKVSPSTGVVSTSDLLTTTMYLPYDNTYFINDPTKINRIAVVVPNRDKTKYWIYSNDEKGIVREFGDGESFEKLIAEGYIKNMYYGLDHFGKYAMYDYIDNTSDKIHFAAFNNINTTISLNNHHIIKNEDGIMIMKSSGSVLYNTIPGEKEDGSDATTYAISDTLNILTPDGNYQDRNRSIILTKEYDLVLEPEDATKDIDDMEVKIHHIDTSIEEVKLSQLVTMIDGDGKKFYIVISGSEKEQIGIEFLVSNGYGYHGQDFRSMCLHTIGGELETEVIAGLNPTNNSIGKVLFTKNSTFNSHSQYLDLSVKTLGWNIPANRSRDIQWTISGNNSKTGYFIRSNSASGGAALDDTVSATATGASVKVSIHTDEADGSKIKCTATLNKKSVTITIFMFDEYQDQPRISSLSNFGRNFTSLTKIDRIPDTVGGDNCLKNFLKGCTSFNQPITIPANVYGDGCLEGFLSDCTSFNQVITIPTNVTGVRCLSRFLEGCSKFNQSITIPTGVTGKKCLMRFLSGCSSFNQAITIPNGVSGDQCLDHFLFGCIKFNQAISLPTNLSGNMNIRGFMRDTNSMISRITIPSITVGNNAQGNGLTLANFYISEGYDVGCPSYEKGVPIVGAGASIFRDKLPNMLSLYPLRNLT